MSSSPMEICNTDTCDSDDCNDIYSSPDPIFCDCQNQLGHFNMNGIPHENLPDLCKKSMGIKVENTPISSKDDETFTLGSDDINPDKSTFDPDPEWQKVVLRRANRNQPKDLARNDTGIVMDKDVAADLTRKKGCKRRISDKENESKEMDIRVKYRIRKKRSMFKMSVKVTLPGYRSS